MAPSQRLCAHLIIFLSLPFFWFKEHFSLLGKANKFKIISFFPGAIALKTPQILRT